jgi:predicted GNAT family acetyltransferase
MPLHLVEAGFATLEDFWAPWCAATVDGVIAALCFAARIGPRGLEAGVYTFAAFRGQGLAAAVTAAWSSLPELADKALFYSTSLDNHSSQRVAKRLGLRRFAISLALY